MILTGSRAERWLEENSPFFKSHELRCKCGCGQLRIDTALVDRLNNIRSEMKIPLTVTSGYRCPAHNKAVGGAAHSFHVEGMAVDIAAPGASMQDNLVELAKQQSIGGIIIYPSFVHLDTRVKPLLWDKRNG